MTTVSQLIEHLKQYPADAPVVYQCCSEPTELDLADITFHKAEDQTMTKRNGQYMRFYRKWQGAGEVPEFVTAVHFPGN